MRIIVLVAVCFAASAASSDDPQRIVGGTPTTIDQYPSVVALLGMYEWLMHTQVCSGVILNIRSVLTAAHCPINDKVSLWRIRVGSNFAWNEGVLHEVNGIIVHPYFWQGDRLHDIAILRSKVPIEYNDLVQIANIAGPGYILPDNTKLVAVGWDVSWLSESDQLRYAEVTKVNEKECNDQYDDPYIVINEYTLCTSNPVTEGPEYCEGESGGPVFHDNVVVGISTFENKCDGTNLPRIYTRIASHTEWIVSNA